MTWYINGNIIQFICFYPSKVVGTVPIESKDYKGHPDYMITPKRSVVFGVQNYAFDSLQMFNGCLCLKDNFKSNLLRYTDISYPIYHIP